ncbi:tRNA (guanine(26)-N(2))-dimethyltransferase [Toxorhynchites rutilus septentrionalis]|uniref:tRNA (guanine(26)-N(2))-dimethyltransferase n=1 Tax=Toxorhynchites rutilus septentrionalis TaxID=329112 RepID=UPI0024788222|nr:tRNA (guanine(26)-N(2))-dimethyltransferase [Toxorhynchites rutilus septentrionalis]XP_055634069.1 tRNA (guanine(26)-N(2))-dimethyltransferase [Toxorhynchites rutilus septentrionalis]
MKANAEEESFKTIHEGSAEILVEEHVFYNPVQEFNRDLSICVLSTFSRIVQREKLDAQRKKWKEGEPPLTEPELVAGQKCEQGLRILEALSATGLRSIRYANEIPGVKEIIANDLSKSAVASIEKNVKHNKLEHLITPSFNDAMTLMYTSTHPDKRFTAIDLDPYGHPTRFLDGAVQSIDDGGLLLVTATDMAVLAGNSPEACYVKYGSVPLKTKACHEMALRILLRCIESTATRYGRYMVPLLSISADFYIRVFVRIFTGQYACKKSSSKQSMVYQCTGCESFTLQPLGVLKPNPSEANPNQIKFATPTGPFVSSRCEHCHHQHHMGGPIWSDALYDEDFLKELLITVEMDQFKKLGTIRRIYGTLSVIREELRDVPLYYTLDRLCGTLKLEVIPMMKFRSALLHAGYRVSYSHACKTSIKTDAPVSVLWDILRCWSKLRPIKKERLIEGTPITAIFSKESSKEYNLEDIHPSANPPSRKESLSRFPENPAAHWGPGTRATLMVSDNKMLKSVQNQNKRRKGQKDPKQTKDTESPKTKQLKSSEDNSQNESVHE